MFLLTATSLVGGLNKHFTLMTPKIWMLGDIFFFPACRRLPHQLTVPFVHHSFRGLRFLNNAWNIWNTRLLETMTSLMLNRFRLLTRAALMRLASIWETRHVPLLTETVSNVSKADMYIHQDAGLRVSQRKRGVSLTGFRCKWGCCDADSLTCPVERALFPLRWRPATSLRSTSNNAVFSPLNHADEDRTG